MQPIKILSLTAKAAVAITAARFVGFAGNVPAAGAGALGIAEYDAKAGDLFAVTTLGTEKIVAGGAFAAGADLQVGPDGKAVVRAAGVRVAKALEESAGDGVTVTVLLTP